MELRIPRKGMAVLTAAVLLGSALFTAMLNTRSVSAVEDKQEATQATTAPAAETEIPETTAATDEEYEVTAWWKADLSDYRENLSLVSYETVEVPTEEPTEAQPEGVVVNDTGVSYIEPDSDYQAIQIVPETGSAPVQRPESDTVDVAPGNFAFTTYGYGHGVGMSQNGANHYASC